MKLILLLLVLVSNFVFGAIDECKTDVYFGNGILTEKNDAIANTDILREAIIEKLGGLKNFNKRIGRVDYAYNSTHTKLFDLAESLDQKLELIKLRDKIAALFGYITSHREDLKEQIKGYEESIRNKHGVLVVANSQGSPFTQDAYDALSPCV